MQRLIVKDTEFLTQQSEKVNFTKDAGLIRDVIVDLLDTADVHKDKCVGLAAIQIGYPFRIFIVKNATGKFIPYINPIIVNRSQTKVNCEEGCLSLDGTRKVLRHTWIKMMYTDRSGKLQSRLFSGFEAEVIQHEYDHLSGKLI